MDKNMRDRLVTSQERLEEIDKLLLDEHVASDMNKFKALSKERSSLEPIVEKFNEYNLVLSTKEEGAFLHLWVNQSLTEKWSAVGEAECCNQRVFSSFYLFQ